MWSIDNDNDDNNDDYDENKDDDGNADGDDAHYASLLGPSVIRFGLLELMLCFASTAVFGLVFLS